MHALGMSKSSFFGLHLVPTAAVLKVGSRLPVAALSNAQGWLKAACSSLEPAWLKAACSNPEPFAQGCAGPSHEISNTGPGPLHAPRGNIKGEISRVNNPGKKKLIHL